MKSADAQTYSPGHPQRVPHYPGVDLLRALAAALVLVYHMAQMGPLKGLPDHVLVQIFTGFGWIGVDLFLVISGFVIALSAFSGVQQQGAQFRRSFAIRRLARIVPLYLMTCVLFVVLLKPHYLIVSKLALVGHIGSHLLFLHNLMPSTHGSINGPSWSVALEMQFYLLMMWLAPWLARHKPLRVLLVAVLVAAAWRFLTTLIWVPGVAPISVQFVYLTQLPGTIDAFALGIAMALAVTQRNAFATQFLTVGWRSFLGWFCIASVLLFAVMWMLLNYNYWGNTTMLVGWRLALALGFAAMLASVVTLPIAGARLLAPLRYLGTVSYGIYLWHMLVIISIVNWVPHMGGARFMVTVLACTLLLASLSWHLLEKPNINQYKS
jgi:peptidoglycan/LPS O-acetylase OafA/YrhL